MKNDRVWQDSSLTHTFLEGVRGAIPLAQEQIDTMLLLVRAAQPQPTRILDLGCGDGILGDALRLQHPEAEVVFADFSEPMLDAARKRLRNSQRCYFMLIDYGQPGWQDGLAPFDVIVSGYSIHHQPDERKREIYSELYALLVPGGIFVNVEHVASATPWVERRFAERFIEALYVYHRDNGNKKSRETVAREYYDRPDKAANILTPVETQCAWLREVGFVHVDCYLKVFELAVFGGVKPGRPLCGLAG